MTGRPGGLPAPKPQRSELRVGRLTKAHGLKGALKLELYTDEPDLRFQPGSQVSLQVPTDSPWFGQQLTVKELRYYNNHPVVFFDGVDDRTAAESLSRAILWVEYDPETRPSEEDAWFDHQLVGLDVLRDDAVIGQIQRLDHLPAQDLIVVATNGGDEVLLPFVKQFVPEVNIEGGFIRVTPPGGLFEPLEEDS
jgi:16S rRNA processing protein RimM